MTTMNKTELKQAVTKIKKFLKKKDYAAIDTGGGVPSHAFPS